MAKLKRIKINLFDQENQFLMELSKKQRFILKAFNIREKEFTSFHGY